MIPRPRIRLPIWASLGLVGAAYLVRAWVWKGGDLSPELPSDGIALGALAVGVAIVAWVRHTNPDTEGDHCDGNDECGADQPRTRS